MPSSLFLLPALLFAGADGPVCAQPSFIGPGRVTELKTPVECCMQVREAGVCYDDAVALCKAQP